MNNSNISLVNLVNLLNFLHMILYNEMYLVPRESRD